MSKDWNVPLYGSQANASVWKAGLLCCLQSLSISAKFDETISGPQKLVLKDIWVFFKVPLDSCFIPHPQTIIATYLEL